MPALEQGEAAVREQGWQFCSGLAVARAGWMRSRERGSVELFSALPAELPQQAPACLMCRAPPLLLQGKGWTSHTEGFTRIPPKPSANRGDSKHS